MMAKQKLLLSILLYYILTNTILPQDEPKLKFSHKHGFFSSPFELQISFEAEGAKIKYTLNGSDPLTSGSAVISNSPVLITIDPSNTANRDKAPGFIISACAVLNDTLASEIITQTYLFPDKIIELSPGNQLPGSGWLVPGTNSQQISYGLDSRIYNNANYKPLMEEAFNTIPTLSLVTDLNNLFNSDSGIYVNAFNHGEQWERKASLELLNPDSSKGFQINCGIRIRGGWSRHPENPKRAFRFFFRKEYGAGKLNYPLFGYEGTSEFDKVDLATAMNYSWSYYGDANNTFLRDHFSRDTQRDMNQPYTRSKYYHLYINGTYWGLYYTQERSEASFSASYFGGSREDYDVIKVNTGENFNIYQIEATDGTIDKWRELWQAGQTGFVSDEIYFKVQGLNVDGSPNPDFTKLLDVDNLIDYMLNTFFVGDFDGPISAFGNNNKPNNFYTTINRVKPGGFKFFRHDAEHSMGVENNPWGLDRTGPFYAGTNFLESNPQWIHQKLSESPHYRLRFADRVYKHMFNNGALTHQKNLERLNKRKQQIETAIIAESARWGDSKVSPPRTKADWTNAVNFITQNFLPSRNSVVITQLIKKGLFSNNLPPQFNQGGGIVGKGFSVELSSTAGKIYYTLDGTDPYLPFSDSIGSSFNKEVIKASASKKVLVPANSINSLWKSDVNFDDSQWLSCTGLPGGVGYEAGSGYESFITLSVRSYMYQGASNPNNSCYIRIPFEIDSSDLSEVNLMNLQIMFDDGFAAYINGVKVADQNAPTNLAWNSSSTAVTDESESYMTFDISTYVTVLKSGKNLLAIHGLNTSSQSSDFLILPKLTIGKSALIGAVSPSAIEYNSAIPINETVTIKTRAISGANWTPLNEASFIIDEDLSGLRITELHYHPLEQDTTNDTEYEFIELKNCSSEEIVLTGATFINGIEYTFNKSSVTPGEFVVLASNKDEFNKRYGFMPFDEYEGQFDNAGERVVFVDAAGDTVFSFRYNDKAPWPEEADGTGYSLAARNVSGTGDPDSPDYWIKSGTIHGSPGMDDIVSNVNNQDQIPGYELYQNYPNPFNPATTISFTLPQRSHVKLKIYDILGKEITLLINKEMGTGRHSVIFDASQLTSGIYFYQLTADEFQKTNKLILMK